MFARMCKGRSYNCIRHLCETFSYITLITLCENSLLPGGFRAACCDLLRLLYIDRYPQLRDCGRPGLPELLWVYEVVRVWRDLSRVVNASTTFSSSHLTFKH